MIWRPIMAFLFGAGVGLSGALLHNSYRPIGLLLSLLALVLGAHLVREMHQSRASSWLYLIGWLLIIIRGSSIGNGGEILIEGNLYGNALVIGGILLVMIATLRRRNPNN